MVASEENDVTDKSADKTVDLVSSAGDQLVPAKNGSEEDVDTNEEGNANDASPNNINENDEEEMNEDEENAVATDYGNGVNDPMSEETTVDNSVNGDLATVDPSSDFELSEADREDSVPTEDLLTPGDDENEEDSTMMNDDDQEQSEVMEVAES